MSHTDSFLASLVSGYVQPSATVIAVGKVETKTVKVKASQLRAAKNMPKVETLIAAPIPAPNASLPSEASKPVASPIALPAVGTLDAEGYIKAQRKARSQAEKNAALAAYVGHNPALPYGTQESEALRRARLALRPETAGKDRTVRETLKGFVAGANSAETHMERRIAHLRTAETATAETWIDLCKAIQVESSPVERVKLAARAKLEKEKLNQIRADLAHNVQTVPGTWAE